MHDKEMWQNHEVTAARTQQTRGMELENFVAISNDIMWVGGYWTSGKHLKHYDSFRINGIIIPVRSFCYIMIEKSERLVAYILDLYEDKKSQKKMKVRWLHKSKEIKSSIPPPQPLENELFMTRYTQVLRLECCDGVVYVLTPNHFEVSMPNLSTSGEHVYVCGRHFGNEGFKPYDVSMVKGYWGQKIFSSGLIPPYLADIARANTKFHEDEQAGSVEFHEDEQAGSFHVIKSGTKAPRSARRRAAGRCDALNEEGDWMLQQESCCPSYDTVNTVTNNGLNLLRVFHDTDYKGASAILSQNGLGKAGNKVEILSDDSGLRGCWFRCTVLEANTTLKVRYDDVLEVDSDKQLEEWFPANKIAPADKLGFRIPGRQMMRPIPPEVEIASAHELGSAVDVWGGEGWWEGIVMGRNASGKVEVAFPAEEFAACFEESKVRISREWVDGQWRAAQCDANIISKISGWCIRSLKSGQEKSEVFCPEFIPDSEAASQPPHFEAECREGLLPGRGVDLPVPASYLEKKVSESPSINENIGNACLFADLKSTSHQSGIQAPIFLECKEGIKPPNYYCEYSGKVAEPTPIPHHEDFSSKCIPTNSCTNRSEDNGGSQLAELQQLDMNRGKENTPRIIDMTSESRRLVSKKRHADVEMDSPMFLRTKKSGLLSRDPSVDLLQNQSEEQEDLTVGVFSFNKLTELGNVEVNRSQYGFEQVSSPAGAPVGGPLFNSVSVQNAVLSR